MKTGFEGESEEVGWLKYRDINLYRLSVKKQRGVWQVIGDENMREIRPYDCSD